MLALIFVGGGSVGPGPPVADFIASTVFGSAPLTVNFLDLSTGSPTSWLWDFGDGTTSTLQNPSHTYYAAGVYTVSLTATNASGSNTATKVNYITVSMSSVTKDATHSPPDGTGGSGGASLWEGIKSRARVRHREEERQRRRSVDVAVAVMLMRGEI